MECASFLVEDSVSGAKRNWTGNSKPIELISWSWNILERKKRNILYIRLLLYLIFVSFENVL